MPDATDGKRTALVVDDEQVIRVFLTMALEEKDLEVEAVGSLAAAIESIEARTFDLALLDKNLGTDNGLEIAHRLAELPVDTEVIIVSGFANLDSALDAMRIGVADYLTKPFKGDILERTIERVLATQERKRAQRQALLKLERENQELAELSTTDPLTRLYNHAYFKDSLEREVLRSIRHGLRFGLLFVDLDKFKNINDTMGHLAGDALLRRFGELLGGETRPTDLRFRLRAQDIAARYGGDEFAIILPDTPKVGAAVKGEGLRAFVEQDCEAALEIPGLTISLGVAAYPDDAADAQALIHAADLALYAAKQAGRNRIVSYSETFDSLAHKDVGRDEVERLDALQSSLDEHAFDFAYQPIVHADSGEPFAYEALCRPRNPFFPHPGVLIQTAEHAGRITALGRVLRNLAVAPIDQIPSERLLFVNLHPQELNDPNLTLLEPIMASAAHRIVLEITETESLQRLGRIRDILQSLRDLGFKIALDDLGSGYGGLSSLTILEPDFVKLDMGLVRKVNKDPRVARLAKHLLEFASDEGMLVIAEGIETDAERDKLLEMGCPLMQGYLFGRPVPLSDYANL